MATGNASVGQGKLEATCRRVGRARHDRLDAERRNDAAIAALATAIGAGADEVLQPVGVLELPPDVTTAPEALRATALEDRADLLVARSSVALAQREIAAADALRSPDLTWGSATASSRIQGFAWCAQRSWLWERAVRAGGERGLRSSGPGATGSREVTVAISSYQKMREAVLGFDREVNERLHENLELARESFASGKIDYYEFNVVRRELIANRLAYLDAFEEAIDARSELQRVTGTEVTP